jgi:hypothetical protein
MFDIIAGVDKHLTFRRPSVAGQCDSSSDTGGGGKAMPVTAVPAPAPEVTQVQQGIQVYCPISKPGTSSCRLTFLKLWNQEI